MPTPKTIASPQAAAVRAARLDGAIDTLTSLPSRLLDSLDAGTASPIQALCAPAGWGKTELLRHWRAERWLDRRQVWITAEPDLDALDLARLLVTGWGHQMGAVRREVTPPAAAGGIGNAGRLGIATAEAMASGSGLVIIDDLHRLTDDSALEFLGALLSRIHDCCHVVLAGRRFPPELEGRLGLAFVPTLRPAELRLTLHETTAAVAALLGSVPSEAAVRALHQWTGGWPAGVVLAARSGRELGGPASGMSGRGNPALARYLEHEIVADLAPDARMLLMQSSIAAGDLTAALAAELTGDSGAPALLEALAASGGFVSATGHSDRRYRVMPLLADFLQEELLRSEPELARAVHRRAAHWYETQGAIANACHHAVAAGDVEHAVRLIGAGWLDLSRAGQEATVQSCLEAIEPMAREDVTLAFVRGWLAGMRGRGQGLRRSLAVLASRPDDPIETGPGTAAAASAILRAAFVSGIGADGAADAREAAAQLRPGSAWWAVAQCLLGYHLYWLGDRDEARAVLLSATSAAARQSVPTTVLMVAYGILAMIDASHRSIAGARHSADQAVRLASASGMARSAQLVPALVARALTDAMMGDVDTARRQLEVATADARREATGRYLAVACLANCHVRQLSGDREAAAAWLRSARVLVDALPTALGLHAEADLAARKLKLRPRRIVAEPDEPTRQESRVLQLLAAGLTRGEIAEQLGVSQDTIKTHVRSLYVKLEADSRTSALERARLLGFLPPAGGRGAAGSEQRRTVATRGAPG